MCMGMDKLYTASCCYLVPLLEMDALSHFLLQDNAFNQGFEWFKGSGLDVYKQTPGHLHFIEGPIAGQ